MWLVAFAVFTGIVLVTVAVRAYNNRASNPIGIQPRSITSAPRPLQGGQQQQRGKSYSRLSHQLEAERLRHALGLRFLGPGREKTTITGTLTIGADRSPIRIVRTQTDDGEQVEIAIGGGGWRMTWNATEGARIDGLRPAESYRAIIERLALDSADQFVLAQLRGASYRTVAINVIPSSAAGSDDYSGPTWDVVRIGEPNTSGTDSPLSKSRSFHINTSTGLIDRCFSQEGSETIVAEMTGWVDRFGENVPTRITWSRDGQPVMELNLNGIAHGPKQ